MSIIVRNNSSNSSSTGGGNGENGYISCAVNILSIVGSNNRVKLCWEDPQDTTLDNIVFVEWSGTIVVRKEGSPPANETDGTVLLDNKTRNAHSSNPFLDNDVLNDHTYYYGLFPYTENNVFNYELANIISVKVVGIHPTFSENTWESVVMAVNDNSIPDTWKIGDTLGMQLSGTYNGSFPMTICDFAHYDKSDGSGKNHITFISNRTLGSMRLHNNDYIYYNYSASDMHNTILPNIYNSLPSVLKNAVKQVKIPATLSGDVRGTVDERVFIPSAYELFNGMTFTRNEGTPFPLFTDNNSRKVQVSGGPTWVRYWTRTPYQMQYYYTVEISGYSDNCKCSEEYPCLRFGFCL